MARIPRNTIFIGGKLHSGSKTRDAMIALYDAIIKTCEGRGFKVHPSFLANHLFHPDIPPNLDKLKLDGVSFRKLREQTPAKLIFRLKRRRVYEDDETLLNDATAARILDDQMKSSVAGIFLLTEKSGGALYRLGSLVNANIPCLCVSDTNNFGTNVNGDPSGLLFTQIYKDKGDLVQIVGEFLDGLPNLKSENFSITLPAILKAKLQQVAKEQGVDANTLIAAAIEDKIELAAD